MKKIEFLMVKGPGCWIIASVCHAHACQNGYVTPNMLYLLRLIVMSDCWRRGGTTSARLLCHRLHLFRYHTLMCIARPLVTNTSGFAGEYPFLSYFLERVVEGKFRSKQGQTGIDISRNGLVGDSSRKAEERFTLLHHSRLRFLLHDKWLFEAGGPGWCEGRIRGIKNRKRSQMFGHFPNIDNGPKPQPSAGCVCECDRASGNIILPSTTIVALASLMYKTLRTTSAPNKSRSRLEVHQRRISIGMSESSQVRSTGIRSATSLPLPHL